MVSKGEIHSSLRKHKVIQRKMAKNSSRRITKEKTWRDNTHIKLCDLTMTAVEIKEHRV